MPLVIEHIDEIARRLNRDVLLIGPDRTHGAKPDSSWKSSAERKSLLAWLEEHHIDWEPCGWLSTPGVTYGYEGDIYLDLPYAPDDVRYQQLQDFVQEQDDGSTKWPGVRIYLVAVDFCRNRQRPSKTQP
ncbi:hypothetical protein [Aquitalea magnusonii]|uniref:Uncharacterized protein n=1 Tax=Aquitalea magnusonii TaxID=332411 RepID=A0A318J2H8_9NEIS|nr:hypothetical protein [Aquitalea magnusonii]PXX42751.1 hypothetical protein DFR38_11831 [Aquitalea magnusonii]